MKLRRRWQRGSRDPELLRKAQHWLRQVELRGIAEPSAGFMLPSGEQDFLSPLCRLNSTKKSLHFTTSFSHQWRSCSPPI